MRICPVGFTKQISLSSSGTLELELATLMNRRKAIPPEIVSQQVRGVKSPGCIVGWIVDATHMSPSIGWNALNVASHPVLHVGLESAGIASQGQQCCRSMHGVVCCIGFVGIQSPPDNVYQNGTVPL